MLGDHRQQLADADVLDRGADEDRDHRSLARSLVERRLDLLVGERFAIEVLHHEIVARLGGGLDQRVAPRVLDALELLGDRHLLRRTGLVDRGVLLDHVDVAAEGLRRSDGQVDRGDLRAEPCLQLVQRGVIVGVLAVHLVDEHEARQAPRVGEVPDFLRADLDAGGGVDDHDRRVDRGQRLDDVGLEVGIAGRVNEGDADAVVLE